MWKDTLSTAVKGWRLGPNCTVRSWTSSSFSRSAVTAVHSLLPQGADVLGGLHLGGPGVQEPGPGLVGGGHLEEGRPLQEVDLQGLGVPGGEGVPLHLIEQV